MAQGERQDVAEPADVVRTFFERMQARDWAAARSLLSPNLTIQFTHTGERFEGDAFIAMNEAYPDGWAIEVVQVVAEGDAAAAQVRVDHGTVTFWCAGFYTVDAGMIVRGTEHWVTQHSEEPPGWRRPFTSS